MNEYHKIKTVFKRDPANNHKTLLMGQYSMPELEYLKDNEWVFTEKIDGTNIRVIFNHDALYFRGKSDKAEIPKFLEKKLEEMFDLRDFIELFGSKPTGIPCLYGEGYGAKIQKGGGNYIKDDVSFILFDVRVGNWWLKRDDVVGVADKLGIDVVPIVGVGTLSDAIKIVEVGGLSAFGGFLAEGLVMKPLVELQTRSGQRIITKIKHKDFRVEGKVVVPSGRQTA